MGWKEERENRRERKVSPAAPTAVEFLSQVDWEIGHRGLDLPLGPI